ncbi:hypothetical protein BGZ95_005929 [Linnemannia exigua]|uniref:Galactose oxidase n=1 Tax=Linnemannia exigua TaxID=604196 RepID=A0AAD4DGF6_9FUNG|nr:hypothetical protein BGZ95_005929 [Linnemannia exigua]
MTTLLSSLHTCSSSSEEERQQPSTSNTLPNQQQQQQRLWRHRPSSFSSCLKFTSTSFSPFLLPLLLIILLSPQQADAQPAPFQPISYAASAVLADGHFYLYGGAVKFAPKGSFNTGSNQFLKLDLTKTFDTSDTPWVALAGGLTYTMLQAAPSKDGKHFVTGGNRDNLGALSHIYNTESKTWTTTANLPSVDMTGYKRSNVGMALDKVTGLMYIFGGFQWLGFSKELSILDASGSDATKMGWTLSINQTTLPALYDPFLVYLPTVRKTLVFGGCQAMNSDGYASSCLPLSSGFLLSNGQTESRLSIENRAMDTAPLPRYQSCRVVLPDGNVFIQGGKDTYTFYADAWILNVTNWTWKTVTITGPLMEMTRAGHACQLGAYGQIIVVGGYFMRGENSLYVKPDVAVIDTGTWTWKSTYNGGPLDCIWPNPCAAKSTGNGGSNGDNQSSDGDGGGSGLSAGAKGGIGAGVVVAILAGIIGFIVWRRRRSSSPNAPHDKMGSFLFRSQGRDDDGPEKNTAGLANSPVSAPRGPSYVSPPRLTVQAVNPQALLETPEQVSPSGTSLPVYTGYYMGGKTPNDEIVSTPSPTMTKKRSLFGISKKSSKPNFGGGDGSVGGDIEKDAALAAALYKAEDKESESSWNAVSRKGTFSEQKDPIPFQQMTENQVRVPSANTHEQKPELDTQGSPNSASSTSTNNSSLRPTIHTNTKPSQATARAFANPQSLVPEEDAMYQRFSPGVPVQTMTIQDQDQDGLYPPLTPTRGYGPTSILIGTTGPQTPSTLVASPLQQTAVMSYPHINAMGAQSQSGHPSAMEGNTHSSAFFGQPAHFSHHSNNSINSNNSNSNSNNINTMNNDSNNNGTPSTPPSRNAQMTRDLAEIARGIEKQTTSEPKGPHALVSSPPLGPRPNAAAPPPLRPRPAQNRSN